MIQNRHTSSYDIPPAYPRHPNHGYSETTLQKMLFHNTHRQAVTDKCI